MLQNLSMLDRMTNEAWTLGSNRQNQIGGFVKTISSISCMIERCESRLTLKSQNIISHTRKRYKFLLAYPLSGVP